MTKTRAQCYRLPPSGDTEWKNNLSCIIPNNPFACKTKRAALVVRRDSKMKPENSKRLVASRKFLHLQYAVTS